MNNNQQTIENLNMSPHAITLQSGMKVMKGHMFVGDKALYFVSSSSGSALWSAIGDSVGGLVGAAISMGGPKDKGLAEGVDDLQEEKLRAACIESGGMVFEPSKINILKHTIWMRCIKYENKTIGARSGFSKPLRKELGVWAQKHGVQSKGMK